MQNECIGAQVRNVVGNIDVHAVHDGHDDNERGGGDDDAQQGQEGAQLVAPERFQSDTESLAGRHPYGDALAVPDHWLLYESRGLV